MHFSQWLESCGFESRHEWCLVDYKQEVIIMLEYMNNEMNMTLTENTYEYDSEVYTMAHYDNDYNKDYTGYDHRGANCNAKEITDPDGAVMYTKIATIPIFKESTGKNLMIITPFTALLQVLR